MIAIVDYDSGNLASIQNMFSYIGVNSVITRDKSEIAEAEKLVLPGVGAFDRGMEKLETFDLIEFLNEQVLDRQKPVLGICLGMQLLGTGSEEGERPGLGWIDFKSRRFPENELKVPHMGWNEISSFKENNPLVNEPRHRFYFVHSYYADLTDPDHSILRSRYGLEFTCGVRKGNVLGVQFHPEKSHKFGMSLLTNFGAL